MSTEIVIADPAPGWQPPTMHRVIYRMQQLSLMLDHAGAELERLDDESVEAKRVHTVAYAKAFLSAEGSVEVRKQLAILATDDERFAMEVAEQKLRACKERVRKIHSQIRVGQSLNSAVKAEWLAGSIGQHT